MRLGRLGHDPMARPAPITLGWVPRPNLAPSEKAHPAVATDRTSGGGNGRATTIKANWPEVVRRIVQQSGLSHAEIARRCDRDPSTATKWIEGVAIPGPGPAAVRLSQQVAKAAVDVTGTKWCAHHFGYAPADTGKMVRVGNGSRWICASCAQRKGVA